MQFFHKSYFKIPVFTLSVIAGVFLLEYTPIYDSNIYLSDIILSLYVVLLSLFFINYRFSNSIKEMGLIYDKNAFKNISIYKTYAILSMLLLATVNFLLGGKTVYNAISINILEYSMLTLIIQSTLEEFVFRGVILKSIINDTKESYAIIISSTLFSIVHFFNPNIDLLSLINIFFAGVLLGYIYIKTNSLLSAIAFHITWNFTQGYIFGVPTSGLSYENAIFHTEIATTPAAISIIGTNFGFESGLLCTLILIILIRQTIKQNPTKPLSD